MEQAVSRRRVLVALPLLALASSFAIVPMSLVSAVKHERARRERVSSSQIFDWESHLLVQIGKGGGSGADGPGGGGPGSGGPGGGGPGGGGPGGGGPGAGSGGSGSGGAGKGSSSNDPSLKKGLVDLLQKKSKQATKNASKLLVKKGGPSGKGADGKSGASDNKNPLIPLSPGTSAPAPFISPFVPPVPPAEQPASDPISLTSPSPVLFPGDPTDVPLPPTGIPPSAPFFTQTPVGPPQLVPTLDGNPAASPALPSFIGNPSSPSLPSSVGNPSAPTLTGYPSFVPASRNPAGDLSHSPFLPSSAGVPSNPPAFPSPSGSPVLPSSVGTPSSSPAIPSYVGQPSSKPPILPSSVGSSSSESPALPSYVASPSSESPALPSSFGTPSKSPALPSSVGTPSKSPSLPSSIGTPSKSPALPSSVGTPSPALPSSVGTPSKSPALPSSVGTPSKSPALPSSVGTPSSPAAPSLIVHSLPPALEPISPALEPSISPGLTPIAAATLSPTYIESGTSLLTLAPSPTAAAAFVDCIAIAAGNATTAADDIPFNVTLNLVVNSSYSFPNIAVALQSVLQRKVAPLVASCPSSTRRFLLESTNDNADSTIVNVLFSTPQDDPASFCTTNVSGAICHTTVTLTEIFFVGSNTSDFKERLLAALDRSKPFRVPGLIESSVGPITEGPAQGGGGTGGGGDSAVKANNSSNGRPGYFLPLVIGASAFGLVLLLALLFLASRRTRQVRHLELKGDDDTLLREIEGADSFDMSSPARSKIAHVVGDDESTISGLAGFKRVEPDSGTILDDLQTSQRLEDARRRLTFPRSDSMGGYDTGVDVHYCQSATCEICESTKRSGLRFIPIGRPDRLPAHASRPYHTEDTVQL